MNDLLTYLISGIALGSSFALIGSGFVIAYRVTQVVNLAQGSLAVFGGLISYSLLQGVLPHGIAELVAVLGSAVVGLVVGVVAIGRRGTDPLLSLIITLGLSIFSSAVIILIWGQDPVSPPGLTGRVSIAGAEVERQRLLIVVATMVTFAALTFFLTRTYLGKGLTACASNPRAARLVGIDVRRMGLIAFGLAGALGGLAGVLVAPTSAISFSSDLPLALNGFAAAIFGRLSSPLRTLAGGLLLGIVSQLVAGYLRGSFQTEVALAMMLLVMVLRSQDFVAEEAK
ncbi:MAG TPA: branched-chain amino acid ABC transporter permease [Kineosporiaceae bacterium]|nr:branched-chain amino acid ABC transporter permease [Kineosporiaceae bacterium]